MDSILESGTLVPILIVSVTVAAVLAFLTALARRWRSNWWLSLAIIITGCGGLALGSFLAVRIFMGVLEEMSRIGGGIASVSLGIWQATQPLLAAAWLALVSTLLASVFVLPRAWKEWKERTTVAGEQGPRASFAWLVALALAAAVTPVLLFRKAMTFVLWVVTPPLQVSSVPEAIANRLQVTATVSACCLVVLIALLVMTVLLARRSGPSRLFFGITVIALVASLGLSAALVVNLRSFANGYRVAALTGQMPSR